MIVIDIHDTAKIIYDKKATLHSSIIIIELL